MKKGAGKTVQARQLGRHLRNMRKEAGFTIEEAAAELGISGPTLYRIEVGASVPRPPDVRTLR
ncbi:MAG: helix-turn-helix domain-containing protein [Micromonosporaceae bacterium]|nr:helix-turn-helix domain-containing protein [Micromonosporaceae bacterium]